MRLLPKAAALSLLAATQFALVLDASIVNVALPSIGRDLGVAPEDLSWVVNAYILMFGGFLLLGGRVADYLRGRRRRSGRPAALLRHKPAARLQRPPGRPGDRSHPREESPHERVQQRGAALPAG